MVLLNIFGGFDSILRNGEHLLTSGAHANRRRLSNWQSNLTLENRLFRFGCRVLHVFHIKIVDVRLDINGVGHVCLVDNRLEGDFSAIAADAVDHCFECIKLFLHIFVFVDSQREVFCDAFHLIFS